MPTVEVAGSFGVRRDLRVRLGADLDPQIFVLQPLANGMPINAADTQVIAHLYRREHDQTPIADVAFTVTELPPGPLGEARVMLELSRADVAELVAIAAPTSAEVRRSPGTRTVYWSTFFEDALGVRTTLRYGKLTIALGATAVSGAAMSESILINVAELQGLAGPPGPPGPPGLGIDAPMPIITSADETITLQLAHHNRLVRCTHPSPVVILPSNAALMLMQGFTATVMLDNPSGNVISVVGDSGALPARRASHWSDPATEATFAPPYMPITVLQYAPDLWLVSGHYVP